MDVPRLTTAQAAARLGIKPQTLYAYVSRGVISSERGDDGSTFDALEVEALADARGARTRRALIATAPPAMATAPTDVGHEPARAAIEAGRPLMVIDSPITLLHGDELYFRGRRATDLARTHSFEQAVDVLWQTDGEPHPFVADRQVVLRARAAGDLLGPSARLIDRLGLTVQIAASYDPLRDDLSRRGVRGGAAPDGRAGGGAAAAR